MKKHLHVLVLALATLAIFALNVLNTACGGIDAEYTPDEPTVEEPTTSNEPTTDKATTEPKKPVEESEAVESDDTSKCEDLDHDGYCGGPKDCDDSPDDLDSDGKVDGYFIHKGAEELCDGVDNDCDGYTDEGLATFVVYEDLDGDGYGAGEVIYTCSDKGYVYDNSDCDDSDADIHPDAEDEPGDGVDSDCDDETAVETAEMFDLTVKVTYRDSETRVFSYQLFTKDEFIGQWWDEEVPFTDKLVFEGNFENAESFLGLRFNIAEGDPADSWYCEGNGRTASLDPSVVVTVSFLGKSYIASGTWSAPDGAGCSGLIIF